MRNTPAASSPDQRTVHLALFDGCADWEYGYLTAEIRTSAEQRASDGPWATRWQLRTVGLSTDPATTMGGLRVLPELSLDQVDPGGSAMLVLPGGDWSAPALAPFVTAAVRFLEQDVPVAAICGATFALATAGILDERRHTSNAPQFLAESGYAGAEHYVTAPAVADRGVVTASGLAPVQFTAEVLRLLGVYPDSVVDLWVRLNQTRDAADFFALQEAVGALG